jgi:tRNA dimethylallyltransferase
MNKLLAIVGPTATGKTGLAVNIAKPIPSVLFSADSRQVFRGMDIVTGKDHPGEIDLYGVDIVDPDQESSVSVWSASIFPWLEYAHHHDLLPVFVGGTGLYIRSVLDPIPTIGIPINQPLRRQLLDRSVSDLQSQLRVLSPAKLSAMNQSDVNNPRRLIRAIEVAKFSKARLEPSYTDRPNTYSELIIGLKYEELSQQEKAIHKRVISRLQNGAVEEVKLLLTKFSPQLPSMTALGYKHVIKLLKGEITETELIESWVRDEFAYAKRQLTWFNKVKQVRWFDPSDPALFSQVASLVKDWYHS